MVSNATAHLFITMWRPFRLGQDIELLLREQSGTILQYLFEFLERQNQAAAQTAGSPELAGGGRTTHTPDRS